MGLEVFILYLSVFTFFSIIGNNFIRKKVLWILSIKPVLDGTERIR